MSLLFVFYYKQNKEIILSFIITKDNKGFELNTLGLPEAKNTEHQT